MTDTKEYNMLPRSVPIPVLDLILGVLLEIMKADRGSIMLLDDTSQELTIRSARGIKDDIIRKARVRLGEGISGKVAAQGLPLLLHGHDGADERDIESCDCINPDIDTSFIIPVRFPNGGIGTINLNSLHPSHNITPDKEQLVRRILQCFADYLAQSDLPPPNHDIPSEMYMMNVFREYSTLRNLRTVFDYIFALATDLLKIKKKGLFLLKNEDSGYFDLILGYGFDSRNYRNVYEELVPRIQTPRIKSADSLLILQRKEMFSNASQYFHEDYSVILPLLWQSSVIGQLFLFADSPPDLDDTKRNVFQVLCSTAGKIIHESSSEQKFQDVSATDTLTGMYNYGLWWKRLDEELNRHGRKKNASLALIVFDIDQLDRFNREHGYYLGDQLLRVIADHVTGCLRTYDLAGRIGGDEFGVALPDTDKEKALHVSHRILNAVSHITTEMNITSSQPISLSAGISQFPIDADNSRQLVEKAKTALVSAKIMGGNGVKTFEYIEE